MTAATAAASISGCFYIKGVRIASTGTGADAGNITLTGTANGNGSWNTGLGLQAVGVATSITSVDGNIASTGTGAGGAGGIENWGVSVNESTVSSSGAGASAGNITLTGTGGTGTGGINHGVYVFNTGQVTAAGPGTITMTGAGGATSGDDVRTETGANVIGGAAAGDVTLAGNTMSFADLTVTSVADIYVRQRTAAGTTIGLGGGAGTLNLTDAELAFFDAGSELIFGRADGTGAMIVDAYNAWNSPVIFRVDPTGSITVSGAQTATAASDAAFTFSGPVALNAGVSSSGATGGTGAILFSDDVTLGANVTVNGGIGGTITFSDIVNGAQDLTLSAGGAITLNGVVGGVTPLDDLTITTNANPAINANVSGGGILTLDTLSAGTTMGLGGAAGTVNYSAAELGRFASGWTLINVGNTAQTGASTVGAAAWSDPVHFRANAAGSVVISGAQTAVAASDTIFTFSGPATINAALDLTNATGGTQAITFNGAAVVNADITSGGGDIAFNDTLSLGADIATGGGDITLADDVTLTGTSSIDTDTADITFAGTLDGTQDLTLATTGDVSVAEIVGGGAALDTLTIAGAGDVTFLDDLTATDFVLTGGSGAVLVTGTAALGGDIDLTTTGAVTFGDAVTYGGDVAVDSGASDIAFNGTVDGPGDLELTTTNDITFAADVGGTTRLGDVVIDPRHFTAGAFNAASFTLTGGTGNVSFAGMGLNTTGDIAIDTNGNVTGTYQGTNGLFDAGAGTITATVSFTGLDIASAGATLSAGYVGAPGVADQAMANLISIGGELTLGRCFRSRLYLRGIRSSAARFPVAVEEVAAATAGVSLLR